jgi:hypothetical protein
MILTPDMIPAISQGILNFGLISKHGTETLGMTQINHQVQVETKTSLLILEVDSVMNLFLLLPMQSSGCIRPKGISVLPLSSWLKLKKDTISTGFAFFVNR